MKKILLFIIFIVLFSNLVFGEEIKIIKETNVTNLRNISIEEQIEEINDIIEEKNLDWVADETSMTKLNPEERRAMLMVSKPKIEGIKTLDISSKESYSSSLDWRSNNGNWVSPIKNQGGGCGSCSVFSSVAIVESKIKINLNNAGYSIDLSEQDIVSCSGGGTCDTGWLEVTAMDYIKNMGIVKESCFEYTGTDNLCSNKCSQNDKAKISYNRIPANLDSIKQTINDYGPITAYMEVYDDFSSYKSGIYQTLYFEDNNHYEGLHSIAIVGYNDQDRYWIIKNSWGSAWGENGFFRISYDAQTFNFDPEYYTDGYFFLDESYVVTKTDIDNDQVDDSLDNCPYDSNSNQEDLDSNGIGDVCECMPDWIKDENICQLNDLKLITYSDNNNCNKVYGLPADNGDYESCDYCQENILGPFYTDWGMCIINDLQERIKYYSDSNYLTCCTITGLESDCRILTEYQNITEYQSCDFCTPNWSCIGYGNCQISDLKYCNQTYDGNNCFTQTSLESDSYIGNYLEFGSQVCDFCTPNLVNSSWSSWNNVSCLLNDIMNQTRSLTQYDNNYCGEVSNKTFVEYRNIEQCDFCQYNVINTSWSEWQNQDSCLENDFWKQNRSRIEYDSNYNVCYALTSLESDLWNNGINNTYFEFQDVLCDYNKDGFIGNETDINTTLSNLTLEVENETNTIQFKEENNTIIEFGFNLSKETINLAEIFIEKQSNESNFSYMLIRGLDLTSQNQTKTVYIDKILDGTGLCIKDEELLLISEVSETCKGTNEFWLSCPGINGNYNCSLTNDSQYKITGLKHSGIKEQETYCGDGIVNGDETCSSCSIDVGVCVVEASSSSSSGGGGGGGGGGSGPSSLTFTLTKEQLTNGMTKNLTKDSKFKATINNETHQVNVDEIKTDFVTITVSSVPQTFDLNVGSQKKIDVDEDNIYDLSIILEKIVSNKAEITVKGISEIKSINPSNPESEEEIEKTNIEENLEKTSSGITGAIIGGALSNNRIIIPIIFIVLIFGGFISKKFWKRKKSSKNNQKNI